MSEPEEECLTLIELQTAKRITENRNQRMRNMLSELHRTKPKGWKKRFQHVQDELIRSAGLVGRLERRIRGAVEGATGPAEEEEHVY
jgi:hypothetical protein